jgi:hypothetical protein
LLRSFSNWSTLLPLVRRLCNTLRDSEQRFVYFQEVS